MTSVTLANGVKMPMIGRILMRFHSSWDLSLGRYPLL